jgi:hypothetical protein
MGVLLIVLGVLLAGVLADFLIENNVATAAAQPITVASTSVDVSTPVIAAMAFGLGALAVLLIVAGIRRFRRTHRRTMQDRMTRLEEENARLVTQENLRNVIRIPEAEEPARVMAPAAAAAAPAETVKSAPAPAEPAPTAAPPARSAPPAETTTSTPLPAAPTPDEPATRW